MWFIGVGVLLSACSFPFEQLHYSTKVSTVKPRVLMFTFHAMIVHILCDFWIFIAMVCWFFAQWMLLWERLPPFFGEGGAPVRRMRGKLPAGAPSSVTCGDSFPQRGKPFVRFTQSFRVIARSRAGHTPPLRITQKALSALRRRGLLLISKAGTAAPAARPDLPDTPRRSAGWLSARPAPPTAFP